LGLQVLKTLVNQVEGGVNQLGRLLGGHGWACECCTRCSHEAQERL
jgi:hypothetical protein